MRARFAGRTDVGRERELNEDAFLLLDDYLMAAVADGLGGHQGGSVASALAVSTLSDFFAVTVRRDATWPFPYDESLTAEENYLCTGIRIGNRRIFDRAHRGLSELGMATTCVAFMLDEKLTRISVANVGDSRCYRLRDGSLVQLTRDHTLLSDAVHMAPWMTPQEIAKLPPNVITRALGIREDVAVDLHHEPVREGDVFLLCSDGLHGVVEEPEMARIVTEHADLDESAERLVERANDLGGPDNITVVLVRLEPGEPTTKPRDED
jgi:protein phosphatase